MQKRLNFHKFEFRKTFEMVDKLEKYSESPANKMLDHTIGKKFETKESLQEHIHHFKNFFKHEK